MSTEIPGSIIQPALLDTHGNDALDEALQSSALTGGLTGTAASAQFTLSDIAPPSTLFSANGARGTPNPQEAAKAIVALVRQAAGR